MSKNLFLSVLILFSFLLSGAQTWLWAKTGATAGAGSTYVLVNTNGDIYINGGFTDSLVLDDNIILYGPRLWGTGYIGAFSPDGNFVNSCKIVQKSAQDGFSQSGLNHDAQGNICLTGSLNGRINFDTLRCSGYGLGYLASFNSDLRAKSIKYGSNVINTCAFDSDSSVYIAGDITYATTQIDTFTLNNPSPNPLYNQKMFLAKLDTDKVCLWVKQGLGAVCQIRYIAVSQNNLFVLAYADTCVMFDTTEICGFNGKGVNFVMDLNFDGTIKWISKPLTVANAYIHSLSSDELGNCYVSGGFYDSLPLAGNTLRKVPGSKSNGFIAKLDSVGTILWATPIYADSLIYCKEQSTSADGFTYVLGAFNGSIIFGGDTIQQQSRYNFFVARYNTDGILLGYKIVHSANAYDIAQDIEGNAIVTGDIFTGTTYFDNIPLAVGGRQSFFLAKLSAITGATAIQAVEQSGLLKIYPNPNAKAFNIDVPEGLLRSSTAQLGIYNSTGSIIKQEAVDISNNRVSVDIGTVQKGIYTVILNNGAKKFTGRVVVE